MTKPRTKPPPVRTCRVCRCTDAQGCRAGCYWSAADLCSTCHTVIDAVLEWYMLARAPSFVSLRHEIETEIAESAALLASSRSR